MARMTGGDVILELMTTVAELKQSMKQQGDQMSDLAATMKGNVHQFGRLAKLIAAYAQLTDARFEEVDERLERLEAASSK